MSALTSLLARDAVVPLSLIEDALQRQVLEGGEIDTALLELDALDENVVGSYRAASYGLSPVSRAELMWVDKETLGRVPLEVAEEHRIVPLSVKDGVITVAAKEPIDPGHLRSLTDKLGAGLEVRIATEVRIEAALALHYGAGIAGRLRILAERLEAREPGEMRAIEPLEGIPLSPGVALDLDAEDESPAPPGRFNDGATVKMPLPPAPVAAEDPGRTAVSQPPRADGRPVEVVPVVALGEARTEAAQPAPGAGERPAAPPLDEAPPPSPPPGALPTGVARPSVLQSVMATPPRPFPGVPKGPLTPEAARELFALAETRDHVVQLFFAFARQYFDASALFSVRDHRVTGMEGLGLPGVERVEQVSLELAAHSALDQTLRGLLSRVADLSRRREDRPLAEALGRIGQQPAALMPVPIRQRAVLFLYGDRGGQRFTIDELAPLVAMLPVVGGAFERIIHARKRHARDIKQSFRPGPPSPEPAAEPPTAAADAPRPVLSGPGAPRSTQAGMHPPKLPARFSTLRQTDPPPVMEPPKPAEAPPEPPAAAPVAEPPMDLSRVDAPFRPSQLMSPLGRQAMSSLGIGRQAPAPPRPTPRSAQSTSREEAEVRPTVQLPAADGAKPAGTPPELPGPQRPGAYHHSDRPAPPKQDNEKDASAARRGQRRQRRDTTRPERPSTRPIAPGVSPGRETLPGSGKVGEDPTQPDSPPEPRTLSQPPPGTGATRCARSPPSWWGRPR